MQLLLYERNTDAQQHIQCCLNSFPSIQSYLERWITIDLQRRVGTCLKEYIDNLH